MNLIALFLLNIFSNVELGIDVLERNNFDILLNKRVGVIVNHTSVNSSGKNLVDLLIDNNINLTAIFSPEHGFKGNVEGGYLIDNSTYRNIPLYSLYGRTKRPTDDMIRNIDVLVFDIQDVGSRFYTYLTTMGYAMEEASKKKIEFVVLDRPNPIGDIIEGPILDDDINAFTAYYKIPTRHSLTPCEMAYLHKMKSKMDIKLRCVKMENYKKKMFFDETNIDWINPSPNIRNLNAALLYPGIGCFEATNISVGRGTDSPFEFFGSPWLNNTLIADELNKLNIEGVVFIPVEKIPNMDIYKGESIKGIFIKIVDKEKIKAMDIFVNIFYLIRKYNFDKFEVKKDEIAKMVGTKKFLEMIEKGKKPDYILKKFQKDVKKFKKYIIKNKIVLYD